MAADRQRRALELALSTLQPEFLSLPASLRGLIPPRPPGSESSREQSRPRDLLFDELALATTSMELTLALLLDPQRCARLVDQSRRDASQPGFDARWVR